MKKTLFIIFVLALCLCLSGACLAEDVTERVVEDVDPYNENPTPTEERSEDPYNEEVDVKAYITEKIVPVIVGVGTSVLAFVATLGTIARNLKALKDTKDTFKNEAKERAEFFESGVTAIKDALLDLENMLVTVPNMEIQLKELTQECGLLAEILSLGFSANSEIIKSGKGKKMALLLEKSEKFSSNNDIRSQKVTDDIPTV